MTSMIAVFTALTVALAPPSSAVTACAASDLRCLGAAYAQDADAATEPGVVAQHLAAASSAYLGLFRETGEPRHLCKARQLATRGLTLGRLRAPLTKYHDEANAELTRVGATCPTPAPRRAARTPSAASAPRVQAPAPAKTEPTAAILEPAPAPPSSAEPVQDVLLGVGRGEPVHPVAVVASTPRTTARTTAPSTTTTRPDRAPPVLARPGRGLLIAGGLNLSAASVLGGVAVVASHRVEQARAEHHALAVAASDQGFTSPEVGVQRRALEAEALHWRRVMLGTSISAAVIVGAAVALLTAGAVKRRRPHERLAVLPVMSGLLLRARF